MAIGGLLATVLVAVVSVRIAMIIAGVLGCCAFLVARASPLGRVDRLEDLTGA